MFVLNLTSHTVPEALLLKHFLEYRICSRRKAQILSGVQIVLIGDNAQARLQELVGDVKSVFRIPRCKQIPKLALLK